MWCCLLFSSDDRVIYLPTVIVIEINEIEHRLLSGNSLDLNIHRKLYLGVNYFYNEMFFGKESVGTF